MFNGLGEGKVVSKNVKVKVKTQKTLTTENPYLAVLLYGAVQTTSSLSILPPAELILPDDFKASSIKLSIHYKNVHSGSLPKRFTFKHMLPNVFRYLRNKFMIPEADFMDAFSFPPTIFDSDSKNMYVSSNKSFYFKFIDHEHAQGFLNLMPSYFRYLMQNNFKTFLPLYCALFRISFDGKKKYVLTLRNILPGDSANFYKHYIVTSLHEKDKEVESTEDDKKGKKKSCERDHHHLKNNTEYKVFVTFETRNRIIKVLREDAKFIAANNVSGWSLMIGRSNSSSKRNSTPISTLSVVDLNILANPKDDSDILDSTSRNSPFYIPTDGPFDYYLGCLDFSKYCKNVKISFSDKSKKLQRESSQFGHSSKSKSKILDPEELINRIGDALCIDNSAIPKKL